MRGLKRCSATTSSLMSLSRHLKIVLVCDVPQLFLAFETWSNLRPGLGPLPSSQRHCNNLRNVTTPSMRISRAIPYHISAISFIRDTIYPMTCSAALLHDAVHGTVSPPPDALLPWSLFSALSCFELAFYHFRRLFGEREVWIGWGLFSLLVCIVILRI